MGAEVFFAAVAQPDAQGLGHSLALLRGKAVVELERALSFAAARLVAMCLPVAPGGPESPAGLLEESWPHEVLIALPVLPGWHDAGLRCVIDFCALVGKAADCPGRSPGLFPSPGIV